MTNPYLNAAQEVTGQTLGQGPIMPVPSKLKQSQNIQENVKKVYVPKPGLKQNPYMDTIPSTKLPQTSTIAPKGQLGDFGALSGFSKIRKMLFLTAIGAGFAASLMYSGKLENLLLAEHPEFGKLRALLPKLKKTALPVVGLFAFPTALALFTDQEWPMLGWLCWLGATAYFLKEAGGDVYKTIKESNEAAEILKEKKLVVARKKRARRKK
jgi:hypothetical protein